MAQAGRKDLEFWERDAAFSALIGGDSAGGKSRAFRQFSLSERYKLQFRMDSFNFTNTPHLSTPRHEVGSSSFMTIHGVSSLAREGIDERQFEFGLKLFF